MTFTVIPTERAIVMDCPRPEMFGWIRDAFPLDFQGQTLLGAPHTLDTCIWLASMGYTPPAPIEYYYDWPRDTTLFPTVFDHQKRTAGFLTTNPRAYCLNGIGTMKTITNLWAADYLMREGAVVGPGLIAAPLETLQSVWMDSIFFHLRHRKCVSLHGSKDRRLRELDAKADFYIINLDGIPLLEKELAERAFKLLIIDELADYRNKHNAWRAMERLVYPERGPAIPWVWGNTGTPTPNAPSDAYHQCRLVTPTTVPKYFAHFRNTVEAKVTIYKNEPRAEANAIVFKTMRPAIRYKRDDCLDLPGELSTPRDVEMTAEQQKHYKAVMKDLYTEVADKKITAVNEGVKLSKLLQIACGVVYATDGTPVVIDAKHRIEVLLSTIERIDEKVIVFVPFTEVTNMLYKHVSKHWSTAVVYGEVGKSARDKIFLDFQTRPDPSVLIAHPGCMQRGLTLTEASTIIWYAPIDSNYIFEQANGRITRMGQKYVANYIFLTGSAVERRAYKRLEKRQALQGMLLEMVEKGEA